MGRGPAIVTVAWRSAVLGAGLAVGLVGVGLGIAGARAADQARGLPGCEPVGTRPVVAVIDSGIAPVPAIGDRVHDRQELVGGPPGGHGTEMAAIIVREAPSARLLDIQVLDAAGRGGVEALADGIDAARQRGAEVINLSVALPDEDAVDAALRRASDAGIRTVIAAGNDTRDLDRSERWRRRAALGCVVVVGATDEAGRPFETSNRGSDVVREWAPGEQIATVDAAGAAVQVDGTSPAAATVSGRIAAGG